MEVIHEYYAHNLALGPSSHLGRQNQGKTQHHKEKVAQAMVFMWSKV